MSQSAAIGVTPECHPLFLPERRTWKVRFRDFMMRGFCRSSVAQSLAQQMNARGPSTTEHWEAYGDHKVFARRLARIIREEIGWPQDRFIPQDPMRLVLYKLESEGMFWDHMELESIYLQIEKIIGRRLRSEEFNRLYAQTFGEAVNFLSSGSKNREDLVKQDESPSAS